MAFEETVKKSVKFAISADGEKQKKQKKDSDKKQKKEKKMPKNMVNGSGSKAMKKDKKHLTFHNCTVVRIWPLLMTTCHYTNMDTLKVKISKKGIKKLTLLNTNESPDPDSICEFPLPTAEDGFVLVQSKSDPEKCFWITRDKPYKKIGFLIHFPKAKKATQFCEFMMNNITDDNNDENENVEVVEQQENGE